MDQTELYRFDQCLVCSERLSSCRNSLQTTTSHSEKLLFKVIGNFAHLKGFEENHKILMFSESFLETSLDEDLISVAAVCQRCMMKFNEYDEQMTKAVELKNELINQLKLSHKSIKLDQESLKNKTFYENFFLNEDFPEIDFDFGLKSFEKAPETVKEAQNVEVSESFAKILEKEGIKYDIDVFQRAFGNEIAETEKKTKVKHHSKNSKVSKPIKKFNKTQFYCELCQISFKAANSLRIHLASDHGKITKNIPCPFSGCLKIFNSKNSLRAHFVCHNKVDKKEVSFFCDKCGKEFFYKLSFTQHLKIHSGVRDKQCEMCSFKAISTTHLQRHVRARHTKEKSHFCMFCDRAFSERYNMTSHMRKQHLEKKTMIVKASEIFYSCIVCCNLYSDEFKLKQHIEKAHNILEVDSETCVA